jgi:hypothetical protein
MTKAIAVQWLADVPQEKQFWCIDGRYLKNLSELQAALGDMSQETFRSHSNEAKNDFSNWVRDVISDEKLSLDLLMSQTQSEAAQVVADRVASLKRRAGYK